MLSVIHDNLTMKDASRYLLDGNGDRGSWDGSLDFKAHSFKIFLVYFCQSRRQPVIFLHSPWYFDSPWCPLVCQHGLSIALGQAVTWYDPVIFATIVQEATCDIFHLLGRI